ncbi:MAG: xanthine dehydrogenase family protein molybdopterin-binding subunit [Planctomycetaceae bacterium]|nr:xanthine dehydrogenase family protein molybdopterin-binding subunit [Planctomycetaceae bacterium]
MANYVWPKFGTATVIGKRHDRVDGVAKATGTAKYAYDINPAGMIIARLLGSPHAHAKIKSIDLSPAKKVPGVVEAVALKKADDELLFQGEEIAVVAAESEAAAAEGVAAIKVEYEVLPHFVNDTDLAAAKAAGMTGKGGKNISLAKEPGDDDDEDEFTEKEINRLLKESAVVVEGEYGIHMITHMCLEPHGSTCEWKDGKLVAHLSTQNVSGTGPQFAGPLGITADDVTVHCDYIGGGFGSKFAADTWGVACAELSKKTGRPVKLMLDRDQELKIAGNRPSGFLKCRVGADKNGVITVWDSEQWGTAGAKPGVVSEKVVPYVYEPKNRRVISHTIKTNRGLVRAWRAPNHPQACAMSQTAIDDIAAKLGLNSLDVFKRNLVHVANGKAEVYAAQMDVAARLIGWNDKWHLHGKGPKKGSIVEGLGLAIHTWGGGGHTSKCTIRISPDGGVSSTLGSQDLGVGTRTAIAAVVAETFGLTIDDVQVNMGNSKYPASGPSGGSTTIGGVSESNRRGSLDALDKLLAVVAPKLGVTADQLEAKGGRIQVVGSPSKSLGWKEACSLLGMNAIEAQGEYVRGSKDAKTGADSKLSNSQVGGVQMAEVAVDLDTGVVKMKKFVAVQDVGTIIARKQAESQVYGSVIMGIAYALFEEQIMDQASGAFVNCEIADYKLPRLGDIGDIVVEMYEPESEYNRGVVGIGEPPVIAPGAAISNAVANAIGVRVSTLPMTPQRVLEALKGRKA